MFRTAFRNVATRRFASSRFNRPAAFTTAVGIAASFALAAPIMLEAKQPKAVTTEPKAETTEPKAETTEPKAETTEAPAEGQSAYNPETGEINWDCPCLGGMAHGPCGEEFKAAFSCFVYSEAEPKGIDCVEKFQAMQNCFRQYPEVYAEELRDEEQATREDPATATLVDAIEEAVTESAETVKSVATQVADSVEPVVEAVKPVVEAVKPAVEEAAKVVAAVENAAEKVTEIVNRK